MAKSKTRTESDAFGPLEIPADKLWGAQTERSLHNFRIGSERMPIESALCVGTRSVILSFSKEMTKSSS